MISSFDHYMITWDFPFPYPFFLIAVSIFSCSPIGQALGQMAWFVASQLELASDYLCFLSPH